MVFAEHYKHISRGFIFTALADDENRITLKPNDDREDCQREYINACYVDVSATTVHTI